MIAEGRSKSIKAKHLRETSVGDICKFSLAVTKSEAKKKLLVHKKR